MRTASRRHRAVPVLPVLLVIVVLSGLMPGTGPSGALAAERVRISLFSWPGYGFWFIAKEKNLAPGVDLDIRIIEDPYQSFGMMKAGLLDVTSSTIEYGPIAAESGNPARIVTFANLSYGTDKIIVGPGIEALEDLKGQRVAVMEGGLSQIFMGIFLEQNGMSFRDVTYVNLIMDDAAAAMIGGQTAAGEFWEPFGSQVLERLPGSRVVTHSRKPFWLKTALLADTCYMHRGFIEEKPELAAKTLKALYDAIAFWMENPEEGNRIIAEGLNFPIEEVERVIGDRGKYKEGGLYIYDLAEAARFMGVAEGDPPFGQKHGQIRDHFELTNRWWKRFGLVEQIHEYTEGVDTSVIEAVWEMSRSSRGEASSD